MTEKEEQTLKIAIVQTQAWSVCDFIFLALAYEGWCQSSPSSPNFNIDIAWQV